METGRSFRDPIPFEPTKRARITADNIREMIANGGYAILTIAVALSGLSLGLLAAFPGAGAPGFLLACLQHWLICRASGKG